jgi:membrane-bound ClpP family serine protease
VSDTIQLEHGRYRPTGKHWFALKLIVACVALLLLSIKVPLSDGVLALAALMGIVETIGMLLKPERSQESVDAGQSLRTIRFRASLLLIAWAALFLFAIQKLF